jgi:hypothetical protein
MWCLMEQEQIKKTDTAVITVKVTKKLKAQMKTIDENWSEYIRQCIQKRINQQGRREAFDKLAEIRKRTKPTTTEEIVQWIREDRER